MTLAPLQQTVISEIIGILPHPTGSLTDLLAPPPSGSIADRWHIYASGYLARLVEAIENDYPATRRILGPGAFGSLVQRYVHAHPSQSYDLGQAGRQLPTFLASDPLSESLPFLPDLARFEWALAEAFTAADAAALTWEAVGSRSPEDVAELPLIPHPSVRVIRSEWPLFALHRSLDQPDHGLSIDVSNQTVIALVHRQGLEVMKRSLELSEAALIDALRPGVTLGELSTLPGVDPRYLTELFRNWVAGELLAAPPPAHCNRT